ncbi:hypothetical protein F4678DRAFT_266894 [Xylaria arbuscula]|nr:hypothetical protein F4678DRAFT_266894 [Xylaria arbuscula]
MLPDSLLPGRTGIVLCSSVWWFSTAEPAQPQGLIIIAQRGNHHPLVYASLQCRCRRTNEVNKVSDPEKPFKGGIYAVSQSVTLKFSRLHDRLGLQSA